MVGHDATTGIRDVGYDEFAMLYENAAEVGLPFDAASTTVARTWTDVPSGATLSAIVWGAAPPEVVFLHGGAQNAHTWDTVALALGRPALAIDLPGHGHSDWRTESDYAPHAMAGDVAHVIGEVAGPGATLVGMSLGGLTGLAAAVAAPGLVERLALVDITPGVTAEKAAPIVSFVGGPEEFESFDAILERTMAFNPTRSRSSLVRGILHNAYERDDGSWVWRYDRPTPERIAGLDHRFGDLWDAISAFDGSLLLIQGGSSPVVGDDDVDELARRRPDAQVLVVEGAGHSIQGDRPLELAEVVAEFHTR